MKKLYHLHKKKNYLKKNKAEIIYVKYAEQL